MMNLLIFRNSNFRLLWVGQLLSQAGIRMCQIAVIWSLVTQAESSAGLSVGLFMVMGALPSLLFVKVAGGVCDRTSTKRILVSSDFVASVFVLTLALLLSVSRLEFASALVAGFLLALCHAFFDPAINKAVSQIVVKEDLEEAVAFQSSSQSLANFGGAMLGALLIGQLGIAGVVGLNGLTYLISGFCNWRIRFPSEKGSDPLKGSDPFSSNPFSSGFGILDGLGVIKKVLLGFGFVNLFATPILVILPLYCKQTLGGNASLLGYLEASLWIGLLIGTLLSKKIIIDNTLRLAAGCLFALGFCLFIPGLLIHKFVYILMLTFGGFALGINNVKFMTLFQETVPSEIKGRFFALMQAVIGFTFPIGYFLAGFLLDFTSPPTLSLIQGIGVISISFYFLNLSVSQARIVYEYP